MSQIENAVKTAFDAERNQNAAGVAHQESETLNQEYAGDVNQSDFRLGRLI